MVERERLVAALERLDPREREVLDWSLHRRVPDEDLAALYLCEPTEVARRRAAAIESLSEELDVRRGEDLGDVLRALLEVDTWVAVDRDYGSPEPRLEAAPEPADEDAEPEPEHAEADEPTPAMPPDTPSKEPETAAEPQPTAEPAPQRGARWPSLGIAAVVGLLLGTGGVVAAASFTGDDEEGGSGGSAAAQTRPFVPTKDDFGEPFPTDPATANRYSTAYVRGRTVLYDRPGGKKKVRIRGRTDWGTPRILGVVKREGDWLAVQAPELGNGDVGWIPARSARLGTVAYAIHVSVSKRRVDVHRDGKLVRRMRVAVGRPGHPTPRGRFSVTDKLNVTNPESVYGCCVLALSGHQTRLPAGWPGGDRLAIHATRNPATIGQAVSLGCMRAATREARWLINKVPVGTPVFIRR